MGCAPPTPGHRIGSSYFKRSTFLEGDESDQGFEAKGFKSTGSEQQALYENKPPMMIGAPWPLPPQASTPVRCQRPLQSAVASAQLPLQLSLLSSLQLSYSCRTVVVQLSLQLSFSCRIRWRTFSRKNYKIQILGTYYFYTKMSAT